MSDTKCSLCKGTKMYTNAINETFFVLSVMDMDMIAIIQMK